MSLTPNFLIAWPKSYRMKSILFAPCYGKGRLWDGDRQQTSDLLQTTAPVASHLSWKGILSSKQLFGKCLTLFQDWYSHIWQTAASTEC